MFRLILERYDEANLFYYSIYSERAETALSEFQTWSAQ